MPKIFEGSARAFGAIDPQQLRAPAFFVLPVFGLCYW